MTEDTWGILGPTFLVNYVFAALIAVVVAGMARRVLSISSIDSGWQPDGEHVAYVAGGPRQAVVAALAGLRAAGAVTSQSKHLSVTGTVAPGPSALTWAVYQAAQRGARASTLTADPYVRPVLADMHDTLVRRGWLLSASRRAAIRMRALFVFAVVAVGVARLIAGAANDKPFGFLIITTGVIAVFGLALLNAPRTSRAAQRRLNQMRANNNHLHPRSAPALATYGAPSAALAVGLFGAAALWAYDPAFAEDADLAMRTTSSGDGGGSGGCGSSSGDSGGSSCGGGGGCGGGGCGG
jgi:uncharacterized protein (TIGR04222 family)